LLERQQNDLVVVDVNGRWLVFSADLPSQIGRALPSYSEQHSNQIDAMRERRHSKESTYLHQSEQEAHSRP